ncbi:MAG: transporter substrate-binding domain-containing protein [Bacteroidales bacterium]|nr:transporter substrate-binding domain-containing protein [Bacteroidales bacterium]
MLKKIIILPLLLIFAASCNFSSHRTEEVRWEKDLEDIKEEGKITVLTDYSSTDYFIYRGQPMGFQYEMLQQLANHLSVRLEVRVSRSLNESFELLQNGEADLIAQNLAVTKDRLQYIDFTMPLVTSRQVLVQRKPENWRKMKAMEIRNHLITSPLELKGVTVYVMRGSTASMRLRNLGEEIGGDIGLIEVDESPEQLINLVSEGEIPFTVCDEIAARVNASYYPDVDISTPVSLEQNMAWAVRKGSTTLVQELNAWLADFTKTRKYKAIYTRYFESQKSATMVESDFYAINTGKISPYDRYIKQYSSSLGWDWRLMASLIYQESRFKNNLTSWAGAWGLMQLMPGTAKRYGVDTISSPREQIRAGSEFIIWLNKQFSDIPDENERIKFILASYNIGPGHVIDARNLARKNGADPNIWDNHVARFLLSKADPKYYNDPVVKYGFCRGTETFNYVTDVLERYEHYKNIVGK